MPRAAALPAPVTAGAFTVADGLRAGATRRRLRAQDLNAPFHGVRCHHAAETLRERAIAYSPKLREGEHFCSATALAIRGAPVPARLAGAIDVAVVPPMGRPRGRGVRGHEASEDPIGHVHGMPVTDPAVAWCQLGALLTERELIVVADALLRRHDPILSITDLQRAVDRWAGRRGVARVRAAMERVRSGTDSIRETELRLDAADFGLPEPEVNSAVRDDRGRFVAFGDLVYRAWKVILEYDGDQHRTDERQFARDVDRLDDLARLGWRVIRVNKQHRGRALAGRLARVREALTERGWTPA